MSHAHEEAPAAGGKLAFSLRQALLFVYGERRDSEQLLAANLSAWLIAISKGLACPRILALFHVYGERRDSEQLLAANLSAWLIAFSKGGKLAFSLRQALLFVYGERRDSEQLLAANLSAWLIAFSKQACYFPPSVRN